MVTVASVLPAVSLDFNEVKDQHSDKEFGSKNSFKTAILKSLSGPKFRVTSHGHIWSKRYKRLPQMSIERYQGGSDHLI